MKRIVFLATLVLAVSCDSDPETQGSLGKYQEEILEQTLREVRHELSVCEFGNKPRSCAPPYVHPSFASKTKYSGCVEFKEHLKSSGIELSEESWKFCDQWSEK